MISLKTVLESAKVVLFISVLTLGFGAPVYAQDLNDPATCLDCHDDADRAPPSDTTRPQVHNPEGGFFQEAHEDFVCIDCHTYIIDLEHEDYAPGKQVDCLECHDEVPTIE
ncbi:MAG: hypothetical protein WBS20_01715 [Lysobacterales bacterium]